MTAQTEERYVPRDTLSNRLFLVRRELGLTHREAEVLTGVGRGSWQSWESGRSPRDEVRKLTRVADALHIDRDWLMFGGPLRPEDAEPVPPVPVTRQLRDIPTGMSSDHEPKLTQAEVLAFRKRVTLSPTDQAEIILSSAAPASWRAAA